MKNLAASMTVSGNSRQEFVEDVAAALATFPGQTHRVVRSKLIRTLLNEMPGEVTPLHNELLYLLAIEGKSTPSEIGRRLKIDKAQISKLLNKLVVLGLVERQIDPGDKRAYDVCLTKEGKKFTRIQRRKFNNAIDTLTESFSDEELKELAVSLRTAHGILCRME